MSANRADLRKREGKGKMSRSTLTSNYTKSEHKVNSSKNIHLDIMTSLGFLRTVANVIFDVVKCILDIPSYLWMFILAVISSLNDLLLPRKRKNLDNETILITGAASGIGRETVLKLANVSRKATFVLWDINQEGLLETSKLCREVGVTVFCYVVDLSKHEDVIATAQKVREQVGNVTILFNNAGILHFNAFLDTSPKMEEKLVVVNLLSYMWTIREFLPDMIKRGSGHIVNTCSASAYVRYRHLSAYVASKYGLKGFLDCLKLEMRIHPQKPNIKFSTIYPTWVETNMSTGITWEPRYKTWKLLQILDPEYVADKIIDGILKEKEEIRIPDSAFLAEMLYGMIPAQLVDRIENKLFQNMKIVNSATSSNESLSSAEKR